MTNLSQNLVLCFFIHRKFTSVNYGKNQPSNKKVYVCNELKAGKDFQQLSKELAIAKATAEVYGIDCFAAGMDIDHEMVVRYIRVTPEDFQQIKFTILSNKDKKLHAIRDSLNEEFEYDQIRFLLACLIQELDI